MLLGLGLIVLAVVGTAIVVLVAYVDDWSRDFTSNHAATSASASDLSLRSLELDVAPTEVREAVIRFVEQNATWLATDDSTKKRDSRGTSSESSDIAAHATHVLPLVHTSKIFGFADDVRVVLQPTTSGTRVDVESQSRVGRGDLGQNPRNIRELLQSLRQQFAVSDID